MTVRSWLLAILILGFGTLGVTFLVASNSAMVRLVMGIDLAHENSLTATPTTSSEIGFIRGELGRAGIADHQNEGTVLAILRWTMNQVQGVAPNDSASPRALLELARRGEGLLCGGMSLLFQQALMSYGIPARIVYLQRSPSNLDDVHVTVEAWVRGKWRLYDPTFHISMRRGDERVGIVEGRDWLIRKKGGPVEIEFLGDVRYPARLATYYIGYEELLRNAFVALDYPNPRHRLTPILGPFLSARWSPLGLSVGQEWKFLAFRVLQYLGFLVLPIATLASVAGLALTYRNARRAD